jgi:tRNA A-37 threonylcarbamoyl transferase component Bud32
MSGWLGLVNRSKLYPLPPNYVVCDNHISIVYKAHDQNFYYKRSIPYLIENELAFLKALGHTNFVPAVFRYDMYTLKIEDIGESMPIEDEATFADDCHFFLATLGMEGIRHGDLTKPHIIVRHDRIKVIDWAEARWANDPAPDKRPPNDKYWMTKTMEELLNE